MVELYPTQLLLQLNLKTKSIINDVLLEIIYTKLLEVTLTQELIKKGVIVIKTILVFLMDKNVDFYFLIAKFEILVNLN